MSEEYRLFVSADGLTLVRMWASGAVEMAQRETPGGAWGPPQILTEEKS